MKKGQSFLIKECMDQRTFFLPDSNDQYFWIIFGYLYTTSLPHHMNILCVGYMTRKLVKDIFRNPSVKRKQKYIEPRNLNNTHIVIENIQIFCLQNIQNI